MRTVYLLATALLICGIVAAQKSTLVSAQKTDSLQSRKIKDSMNNLKANETEYY